MLYRARRLVFCLLATPAFAGGMGDSSRTMRENNAICEAQRRGEGPRFPDLCWPDLSPGGPAAKPRDKAR
jgi:hypothetical protein